MKKVIIFFAISFVVIFFYTLSTQTSADTEPFTIDLRQGSNDLSVQRLQQYLNQHNFPVAQSGIGSVGFETTYFGPLTKQALIAFQNSHADEILSPIGLTFGTGNFFRLTRQYVNKTLEQLVATTTPEQPILPVKHLRSGRMVSSPSKFQIGGTVSNLDGSLVLQNNGTDDLTITQNGSFSFSTLINKGFSYLVNIFTEPNGQDCSVSNGSGTITSSAVTNVGINCLTYPTLSGFSNVSINVLSTPSVTYNLIAPTSDSDGDFVFASSNDSILSISGSVGTWNVLGGTVTVTATQSANDTYTASSTSATYTATVPNMCEVIVPCNGGECAQVASTPGNFATSYTCSNCPSGQSGDNCEMTITNCDGACLNGGVCSPSVSGGECACAACFTGVLCQDLDIACA